MQAKNEGQSEAGEDDIPLGRGARSHERGRRRISFKHVAHFKMLTLVPGTVLEFRDAGVSQENVRSVHSFTHSFIHSTLLSVMCQILFWILKLCLCSAAQLCLALCDSMDCCSPVSSVHGILQARILEQIAISSFRGSSQPRKTCISCVYCIDRRILYH